MLLLSREKEREVGELFADFSLVCESVRVKLSFACKVSGVGV